MGVKKACLLGEAPSFSSDPRKPLDGDSGRRLARLIGVEVDELQRMFVLRNLLDWFPGFNESEKGAAFPMEEARRAAAGFRTTKHRIVLLGKRVAAAFRLEAEYFEWVERGNRSFVVVPHPSGVNHWHNDAMNRAGMRKFFEELMR